MLIAFQSKYSRVSKKDTIEQNKKVILKSTDFKEYTVYLVAPSKEVSKNQNF